MMRWKSNQDRTPTYFSIEFGKNYCFFTFGFIFQFAGTLESMIGDVEIALLALEDTIDAREMQEKQLDQRFQLAMYQERRKSEFNELASKFFICNLLKIF